MRYEAAGIGRPLRVMSAGSCLESSVSVVHKQLPDAVSFPRQKRSNVIDALGPFHVHKLMTSLITVQVIFAH